MNIYLNFILQELINIILSFLDYKNLKFLKHENFDIFLIFKYDILLYINFPYLVKIINNNNISDILIKYPTDIYMNYLLWSENIPYIYKYLYIGKLSENVSNFYNDNIITHNKIYPYTNVLKIIFIDILKIKYHKIVHKIKFYQNKIIKNNLSSINSSSFLDMFYFLLFAANETSLYLRNYIESLLLDIKEVKFDINGLLVDDFVDMDMMFMTKIFENIYHLFYPKGDSDTKFIKLLGLLLKIIYEDWVNTGKYIDNNIYDFYQSLY